MTGNVVYRGPLSKQPQTISDRLVNGALLPGVLVTDDGTDLSLAVAADQGEKVYVLGFREFYDQDITTAYADNDTAVAYEPLPGEVYQVRLAAATYAYGDKLVLGALGRLTKTLAAGDVFVAYFSDTAGAFSAGDLADVVIAAGGTEPA